jgi:hypothetical protein
MELSAFWVRALISEKVLGASSLRLFTQIYRHDRWDNSASPSGDDSDLTQTPAIREALPTLVNRLWRLA